MNEREEPENNRRRMVPEVIETQNIRGNAAVAVEDDSEEDGADVEFGLSSSCKGTDLVEVMWGKDEEETKSNRNELNTLE